MQSANNPTQIYVYRGYHANDAWVSGERDEGGEQSKHPTILHNKSMLKSSCWIPRSGVFIELLSSLKSARQGYNEAVARKDNREKVYHIRGIKNITTVGDQPPL